MSKFGWSYPPGCSGTPYDEEHWCACCGHGEFSCICPECPVCQVTGEPACYDPEGHGLEYSPAQEASYVAAMAELEHDRDVEPQFEAWPDDDFQPWEEPQ